MYIKALLCGTATCFLLIGAASAADRLSETQMDLVTAGAGIVAPSIDCPGCTAVSSSSMSNNGVTVSMTGGGSNSGGSGGSGNTGGTGGTGGTGSSGGGGPTGPSVVPNVPIPANLAAVLGVATTITKP